jgi:56kDa selenium binding protein (SBP56)
MAVVDVAGDELHHFGWNACSACLCPHAPHPHVERRYLVVPGIHSSRIHILDTKPDPRNPKIVKVIEAETLAARTGYASLHTVHCGWVLLSVQNQLNRRSPRWIPTTGRHETRLFSV